MRPPRHASIHSQQGTHRSPRRTSTNRPDYSFLKSLSKALRASSALRGAGGPALARAKAAGRTRPRCLARYGDPRGKERAVVGLILHRDAHRDRLQALKPGGGLEVGALFAAVQFGVALGAAAGEVGSGGKRRGAVETSRRGDMLHQAGKTGAGHVQGRTWALGFGRSSRKVLRLAPSPCTRFVGICGRCPWGKLLRSVCGRKNVAQTTIRTLQTPVIKHADRAHEAARQTWRTAVVSWDYQRGLSGIPEVSKQQAGTRLCCKYICTTERHHLRYARRLDGTAGFYQPIRPNSISSSWYRAGSADRRSDSG